MRVGVVGGSGNISSSVVRLLLEAGHDVTCINRGLTPLVNASHVITIHGDRHDTEWFEDRMQREQFDAAIDFICFNAQDARSDLRAFREVGHLIHTSTVRTYGPPIWMPVAEDHPLHPDTTYATEKAEADAVLLAAYYESGFPVTILKPSTTYGPQRVLRQLGIDKSWLRRIEQQRPILVLGDGLVCHQFLHVDDAAKAFASALGRPACLGQVYNLVNPTPIDWRTYHHTAMVAIGHEVDQVGVSTDLLSDLDFERFELARGVFSRNCYYDSKKLLRDIPEFGISVPLEEGIGQIWHLLRERKQLASAPSYEWEDRLIERLKSVAGSVRSLQ